jgi:hypothetical protein
MYYMSTKQNSWILKSLQKIPNINKILTECGKQKQNFEKETQTRQYYQEESREYHCRKLSGIIDCATKKDLKASDACGNFSDKDDWTYYHARNLLKSDSPIEVHKEAKNVIDYMNANANTK